MGYRLEYTDETGYKSSVEFPDEIYIYDLADYLKYFLASCSWTDEQIEGIFK